jgi:hypothetical protein
MSANPLAGQFDGRELLRTARTAKNAYLDVVSDAATHLWEAAGLGPAPYTLERVEAKDTTCDFCGANIHYQFHVHASNGRHFVVGSDCIYAMGTDGLIADVRLWERKMRREKAQANSKAAFDLLSDLVANHADELLKYPHPSGFEDKETGMLLTLHGYATWMLLHAGTSGRRRALKVIARAFAGMPYSRKSVEALS